MSRERYQQCVLRRGNEEGEAWVPRQYSKKGNKIRYRQQDGNWSDVWTIHQPCYAWVYKGDEVELVEEKSDWGKKK